MFTIQISGKAKDGTDIQKLAAGIIEKLRADGHEQVEGTATNSFAPTAKAEAKEPAKAE